MSFGGARDDIMVSFLLLAVWAFVGYRATASRRPLRQVVRPETGRSETKTGRNDSERRTILALLRKSARGAHRTAAIPLHDRVKTQEWVGPYRFPNAFAFAESRIALVAKQPGPIEDDRESAAFVTDKGLEEPSKSGAPLAAGGDRTGPMRNPKTLAGSRRAHAGSERTLAVRSAASVARRLSPTPETRSKALCGGRASLATEYDPEPVFGTGEAATARPEIHRIVREQLAPTSAASKADPDRTSRRKGGAWGSNR